MVIPVKLYKYCTKCSGCPSYPHYTKNDLNDPIIIISRKQGLEK